MGNNPIANTDPEGDAWFAALAVAMLKGRAIGFGANGINNALQGNNFFQGGLKASAFGALGGGLSHGIGTAADALYNGSNAFAVGSFQAGAHGLSGGITNTLQGGSFGSGFASGAVSSSVGSLTQNLSDPTQLISGSLSGGFGSLAGGGSFIDGVKQGAITVGLNHLGQEFCCSTSGKGNGFEARGIAERKKAYEALSPEEQARVDANARLAIEIGATVMTCGLVGAGIRTTQFGRWAFSS